MSRHKKKVTYKKRVALVTTTAVVVASAGAAAAVAATATASHVASRPTSTWSPPSSDPSGIAFIPGEGLLISDAEVEETAFTDVGGVKFAHNDNMFLSSLDGARIGGGSTVGWSNEPTGVAYVSKAGNPWNGHLFVTDDDQKRVYEIAPVGGGVLSTLGNSSRTSFKTSSFGNSDPEDVAFDSDRNELWIAGGLSTIVSRVNPGADDKFSTAGDNVTKNFPIPQLDPTKPPSPEGMAYDPERQTIYVLDGEAQVVFELARNGALLNTIDLSGIDMQSAGGITLNPGSTGPSRTFYLADRGLDPNGTRPANCPPNPPPGSPECEPFNDGMIHEVRVSNMPAIGNRPPLADAGEDEIADTQETITLVGSGEDGETPSSPAPLTYSWTRISGPGAFTLGTPNAPTTTAMFTQAGTHTLRLTVSDGALSDFDDVLVHVFAPADPRTVTIPIRVGDDDAQESIGTNSNGFTDLESADNELGNTNGADTHKVMTGLRFTRLPIVHHSTITSATVQFSVDEVGQAGHSAAASYVIRGQLTGNAPRFLHGNDLVTGSKKNISSRTPTVSSVAWNNVPVWTTVRDEGPAQRTPDLAPILQEIVNLPDWARGNAAVFTIQNAAGNTGRRTAEAKDGRIPPYLTVTFRTPLPNVAPIVNAGPDSAVTLPGDASLDGTVTDDGKLRAFTTSWSKVSGPGTVSFADPSAVDTTATFSEAGTYDLALTANDGELTGQDTVTVTVRNPVVVNPPQSRVQPELSVDVSDSVVRAGQKVTVSGTLSPALAGQAVKLQRLTGSGWVDVATKQVTGGASANAAFPVGSRVTTLGTYRLHAPATGNHAAATSSSLAVLFHKVVIRSVDHRDEVVKLKNNGNVKVNLAGWVLKNGKNGKKATLPSVTLAPGKVLKVHTGKGDTFRLHIYLGKRQMWGTHGKAVLRDDSGSLAARLRY